MEWIRVAKVAGKEGYDVIKAFETLPEIDWSKSGFKISVGDIVYIYIGEPYHKIVFKTECVKVNVTIDEIIDDKEYFNDYNSFKKSHTDEDKIRLRLIKKTDDNRLSLNDLKELGYINSNIQGAFSSKNNSELFQYIDAIFNNEQMIIVADYEKNYYTASIPISSREWLEILSNKDLTNEEALGIIKRWYLEPEYASSCYEMSKKYNESDYYVLAMQRFVKNILKALGNFCVIDEEGKQRYYLVLFNGWYKKLEGEYVFVYKLRPEIILAIKTLALFEDEKINNEKTLVEQLLNEESKIEKVLENKKFSESEKQAIVKVRIGQGYFRNLLLDKFNNRCIICGLEHTSLLVASHIKEWKNSSKNEKHDRNNGLLLCSIHDALFDNHLISFDDNGKILISDILSEKDRNILKLDQDIKLFLNDDMKEYMKYHRERLKR